MTLINKVSDMSVDFQMMHGSIVPTMETVRKKLHADISEQFSENGYGQLVLHTFNLKY